MNIDTELLNWLEHGDDGNTIDNLQAIEWKVKNRKISVRQAIDENINKILEKRKPMKLGYVCNNCNKTQTLRSLVFNCIECEKEICEDCMFGLATCKECARGKSKEELQKRFDDL